MPTLADFVTKFYDELLVHAKRYATNRISAEEIVQQTSLDVCLYPKFQYRSDWETKAFLKRRVYLVAVALHRGGRGMPIGDALQGHSGFDLQVADPESGSEISQLEWNEALANALLGLEPEEIEILRLKYVEGWTLQEIADHLGISIASVHTRIRKALTKLALILQDFR